MDGDTEGGKDGGTKVRRDSLAVFPSVRGSRCRGVSGEDTPRWSCRGAVSCCGGGRGTGVVASSPGGGVACLWAWVWP